MLVNQTISVPIRCMRTFMKHAPVKPSQNMKYKPVKPSQNISQTHQDKFLMFFPKSRCYRVGSVYQVIVYHPRSGERIIESGIAAHAIWSRLWYLTKTRIIFAMSDFYGLPVLELPNGFMEPEKNIVFSWEQFGQMPEYFHIWNDILHESDDIINLDKYHTNYMDIMMHSLVPVEVGD